MASWIQDPKTGKLIPKNEYIRERSEAPYVNAFKDFVSPIDGSTIANRAQLREHNTKHGVTNTADYGPDWFKRKAKERQSALRGDSAEAKKDRINTILEAFSKHEAR